MECTSSINEINNLVSDGSQNEIVNLLNDSKTIEYKSLQSEINKEIYI